MAFNGYSMMVVQFYVGENSEDSCKLRRIDEKPHHVSRRCHTAIVKTRSIDDVPMLGLTLWVKNVIDDFQFTSNRRKLLQVEKVKRCCDYEKKLVGEHVS